MAILHICQYFHITLLQKSQSQNYTIYIKHSLKKPTSCFAVLSHLLQLISTEPFFLICAFVENIYQIYVLHTVSLENMHKKNTKDNKNDLFD